MTAVFTAEDILEICSGRLAFGMLPDEAGAISTDTRQIVEGQWYLALPGRCFDGHDFLGDAFSAGALGAVVVERVGYAVSNPQFPLLAVEDTLVAYQGLSRNWRRRINPRVALVIGSSGQRIARTCAELFGNLRRFYYLKESSVPAALLSMPYDTQVAMVEMSLTELLRSDGLIEFIRPDLLIMADVGESDLEHFGSPDALALAQIRLLSSLDRSKSAVIIGQSAGEISDKSDDIAVLRIIKSQDDFIEMAVSAARHLGLKEQEISQGLDHFRSDDRIT